MLKIIHWLYLINIFKLSMTGPVISLGNNIDLCSINECSCDLGQSLIVCDKNIQSLANKNLTLFSNLVFNNLTRLNGRLFENTLFSTSLESLSISQIKLIQSNTWAWSSNLPDLVINNLQLSFTNDFIIEPSSFDYLKCDTLLLTFLQFQNNQVVSLNNFGENTSIKHLVLDFQTIINASNTQSTTLFKNNIDRFNKMSDYNQNAPYDEYWSAWYTEADIEHILVKNVKGIHVLDYKFVPNFRNLKKIEIINTDLNEITETFSYLHSKNLKSLTIQKSNIEYIKSNVFEPLVNLDHLDLSFNQIKRFESQTFNGLLSLKTLRLNGFSAGFKNEDLCMLTYLPCKIDLQLDMGSFGSEENCAAVYLNEIRFKRLFSSRQINPCSNLTDELAMCFKLSNRNFNESCVNSYSNDLILADVQFVRNANTTTENPLETKKVSTTMPIFTKFFNHKYKFDQIHPQNDSKVKNNLVENNKLETSTNKINDDVKRKNNASKTPNKPTILPSKLLTNIEDNTPTTKQSLIKTSIASEVLTKNGPLENNQSHSTTEVSLKPRKEDNLVMENLSTQFVQKSTKIDYPVTTEEALSDKSTISSTKTDLDYTSKMKSMEMTNRKEASNHSHIHNANNNELLYVIIIALVIFCMIQFLIGVFIFYLFFANKWSPSAAVGSNQFLSKNAEVGVGDGDEPLDSTPVAANQSILHTILLNAQQQQPSTSTINLAMPGVRLGEGPSNSNIDTIYLERNKANSNSKQNNRNKNKTIKNLYRPPIQFLRDTQSTLSLKWKSLLG